MKSQFLFLAFIMLSICAGCTFSRAEVNSHYKKLDTSWIKPGITSRAEVIAKLGMPSTVVHGRGGVRKNSMRWVSSDTFSSTLEAGYIVTPTFSVSKERHAHDLLIRFDSEGIVELVSRTAITGDENKRRILEWKEASR